MMPATSVQDRTITLNGLRFHYRDWEHEGAPALVVLHGLSGTSYSWDAFAKAMQPRFRVLILDQRGHGETEWATDYRIARWIEDIDAFARALQLSPFALLGHSMGGRNAWNYTAPHPDSVTKLLIGDEGPDQGPASSAPVPSGEVPAHKVFDYAARMVREMPNCRLVELPNAGHYLQGENLDGLVSIVRSFLQE